MGLIVPAFFLYAQTDTSITQPPYRKFLSVPPFKLLRPDSSTVFTKADLKKNRPVLIMLFSPDCDHCRQETGEIIRHIDKFKKIQIIMSTTLPFSKMKQFHTEYSLDRFENIITGRDMDYLLPVYYDIRNLPFLAFYDKKGKLIDVFEGVLPVEKILPKFE
ncbi:MAG: redoxin domain-containing protein [Chitinophagaceae bacterium]|nr:redoxin domain-containing protein [Chitinophagaceae bacterium]